MPANKKMRSQICKHHFFVVTLQQDDYRFRKVNDKYRIEFKETIKEGEQIATICNITELSNHYQ